MSADGTGILVLLAMLGCVILMVFQATQPRVLIGAKDEKFVSPVTWPLAADWRQ